MFNPEIETLPVRKLRYLQSGRLRDLVHRLYRDVPFYKKQLDAARIRPGDIEHVEEIHRLPITVKTDLRDNYPFGLFAVPMEKILRIHASSGTTGKPTVVGYTEDDLVIFSEVCARSLVAAGAEPGMKLHNAYGYGLFTGGLGMHYGAERLGMAVIPVSGGMTERQVLILRDFKPEVICCTPSYAQVLASAIKEKGISPDELALKFAVLGAEPWTDVIRREVESGLGVDATNIYGLSEIIGPGVSQEDWEEKGGSYIWEDHFYPEIIHPDSGEPLPYGEQGVLVITTLTKEAMPLIRYKTNDITHLYYDPDGKRTHIKMGPVVGRADDMLIIRGVNLFPTQVEEVLNNSKGFSGHYQLVVRRENMLDEIELRVELLPELSSKQEYADPENEKCKYLAGELSAKLRDILGLGFAVSIARKGEIPRSQGGKLNRVLDHRKNDNE